MQSAPQVLFTLRAQDRSEFGKGAARRARREGNVPAVVYRAGEPSRSLLLSEKELLDGIRSAPTRNVLVGLLDGDTVHTCLVRDVQRHPVSRAIEHVDLFEVTSDDVTTVDVPLVTTGKAAGVRAGGTLRLLVRTVKVRCSPLQMPGSIELDVTNLETGVFVKASQLAAPEGAQILFRRDYNVVTVEGKRVTKEEAAQAAAAAAAAAKAPAGKAAAKPAAAAAKAPAAAAAKPAAKK